MYDDKLINQKIFERFESYFVHFDPDRHVLQKGDQSVACKNTKTALAWLGFARHFGDEPLLYDQHLSDAVMRFQKQVAHRSVDGGIGPGTRARLIENILHEFGAQKFLELDNSEVVRTPTVFFSYAWHDTLRVNKLEQWLRDNGISVIRDKCCFKPGTRIPDNVWASVLASDKVIAVYTKESKTRDWPIFEQEIAERVERILNSPILVYLILDDVPLKASDPDRIAIHGQNKILRDIGLDIQKALNMRVPYPRYEYDENEPL